jgi:hypothetical protein
MFLVLATGIMIMAVLDIFYPIISLHILQELEASLSSNHWHYVNGDFRYYLF